MENNLITKEISKNTGRIDQYKIVNFSTLTIFAGFFVAVIVLLIISWIWNRKKSRCNDFNGIFKWFVLIIGIIIEMFILYFTIGCAEVFLYYPK